MSPLGNIDKLYLADLWIIISVADIIIFKLCPRKII